MSIQQKASMRRILEDHIKAQQASLSVFRSNLVLCGFVPEDNPVYMNAVSHIQVAQVRLSALIAADVMANADMYSDSRGFHP